MGMGRGVRFPFNRWEIRAQDPVAWAANRNGGAGALCNSLKFAPGRLLSVFQRNFGCSGTFDCCAVVARVRVWEHVPLRFLIVCEGDVSDLTIKISGFEIKLLRVKPKYGPTHCVHQGRGRKGGIVVFDQSWIIIICVSLEKNKKRKKSKIIIKINFFLFPRASLLINFENF